MFPARFCLFPNLSSMVPGTLLLPLCVASYIAMFALDEGSHFYPQNTIENVKQTARNFNGNEQQDAHEFLKFVLDSLQNVCLHGYDNVDEQSENTTLIHQSFSGYLQSQLRCSRCNAVSSTFEHFQDIFLDIQDRFLPSQDSKIEENVRFNEELDLHDHLSQCRESRLTYNLYAVIVHIDKYRSSCHYDSYVKGSYGEWYKKDDSVVTRTTKKSVLKHKAYVLFYRSGVSANEMNPPPN
uniref:Ubiquitin carboxyl-terminal hydrolase 36 n=1 Tax=Eptatretus burgeri TaxID=7764 RepID=A0A8C4WPL5_EPTBU